MGIDALLSVLRYAAPVGLAALGETAGQRAGLINIGLEGTMLSACYAAVVVAQVTGQPLVGLAAALFVAVLVGLLQAFFTVGLGADQVVVGTAVNLMSLGVTSTLFRQRYGASGQLLSVPAFPRLPGGLDPVLLALIVCTPLLAWALFRSKWGLAVRSVGEYPPAAEAAGLSVARLRLQAAMVGSAFAGLAGGYLALGVAGSFAENMTAGRGFVAIAMVTFGRWRPVWAVAASLLVGWADSFQYDLQARNLAALPPQLFIAMPYVLALVVLVVVGRGTAVPGALGVPYKKRA